MRVRLTAAFLLVFAFLVALHAPLLRLPYFWDEAGYYIPAALDFYRHARLIPRLTQPTGHPPLVPAYLSAVWWLFGASEVATRVAMIAISSTTVVTTYALGQRVTSREASFSSAALLALSPLFFAQSSLVFLDLTAALFTTLAILFLLDGRLIKFALAASLAVLSKETAVVLLPVAWLFAAGRRREQRASAWAALAAPAAPLALWALFYHHATGFWTGNPGYLQYNLYSTLTPLHICRSLLARLAELFSQGFNWLLAAAALAGVIWSQRKSRTEESCAVAFASVQGPGIADFERSEESPFGSQDEQIPQAGKSPTLKMTLGGEQPRRMAHHVSERDRTRSDFLFLAVGLVAVYVAMLSVVGGAVLPRYMLPVFPVFFIMIVGAIWRLPTAVARTLILALAAAFVGAWFINPPYPFPYEDNLAYADFVRLHQKAAQALQLLPGRPVILTAWPATDELRQPFLGYVRRRLRVAAINGFTPRDFRHPPSFDALYLYSRAWEPPDNLLTRFPALRPFLEKLFAYQPQASPAGLERRFHLVLWEEFERRGQWVRIYSRAARSRLRRGHPDHVPPGRRAACATGGAG